MMHSIAPMKPRMNLAQLQAQAKERNDKLLKAKGAFKLVLETLRQRARAEKARLLKERQDERAHRRALALERLATQRTNEMTYSLHGRRTLRPLKLVSRDPVRYAALVREGARRLSDIARNMEGVTA